MALDGDLGILGGLIRRADACELGDFALSGLLIQALGVALLGLLDGNVDVDLDESQGLVIGVRGGRCGVQLAGGLPILLEGRDEGGDGNGGRVGEEFGNLSDGQRPGGHRVERWYLGDAADVLVSIGVGESQVLVQAEAHIVAVQPVGGEAEVQQMLFERSCDGRLARGAETGEPDGEAALPAESVALAARQGRVPGDVAGHVLGRAGGAWRDSLRCHCDVRLLQCSNAPMLQCPMLQKSRVRGTQRDDKNNIKRARSVAFFPIR